MDPEQSDAPLLAPSPEYLASIKVFPLISSIKRDVLVGETSLVQLTASDVNFSVVRPIVYKYARLRNLAAVYACLVVRSYFLKESEAVLAYAGVNLARANLCEILATKLLNHFAADYIKLVALLTTTWNPLAGAPSNIVDEVSRLVGGDDSDLNNPQSALEMAIFTESKHFVSSPITQKVVNHIYSGQVVFSHTATRSILADNYKPRSIQIYDWTESPFLDHYRLRVPKYGAVLDFLNFAFLLMTFVLCLANKDVHAMNLWEYVFIVFGVAFALEEYTAAMEHGWIIYIANMWNVFDASFIVIFLSYLGFRLKGLAYGDYPQPPDDASETAFDLLAIDACILFPRLAFFAVSNHVVILSLRAMISEFVFFIGIAAICFSGLLFTLWTLARSGDVWTIKSICWLMVQIWFGNTYLSFAQATSFHPLFGPILMTCFAALSNTLLVTNTDVNATQEYLFQFTISTIEGVKADALFSYQPPFNILAFLILKPASWVLSPRGLHSVNVLLIKLTNFPILIVIAVYERYLASGQKFRESGKAAAQTILSSLPRQFKHAPLIEAIVGSSSADLYDAIFDVEAEHEVELVEASDDDIPMLRSFHSRERLPSGGRGLSPTPGLQARRPTGINVSRTNYSTPQGSPVPLNSTHLEPEVHTPISPIGRLFARDTTNTAQLNASVKRMEAIVDDIKDPVQGLREEIKELQERQSRIESLLLTLTRGMRSAST
ncbi:receptor-activated Ca2+-permeable cation channel [Marasmius fiardii PR-910]|nr:receptor-activated Ca2+-permeable cation channel [Marasmius fiardii PR-910]